MDNGTWRSPAILAACDAAHASLDLLAWPLWASGAPDYVAAAVKRHDAAITACAELAAIDSRPVAGLATVPDVFGQPVTLADYVAACGRLADHADGTVTELWADAVASTARDMLAAIAQYSAAPSI